MAKHADPLAHWLSLTWDRPERSYNPDLRDFLAALLGYPKPKIVTEDTGASGYPDFKLLSTEGLAWVVGDLKKDDAAITDPVRRRALWEEKRKYVDGLTRFVVFLTPNYLLVLLASGEPAPGFHDPLDLRDVDTSQLRTRLAFLDWSSATHERQWTEFTQGQLPYSYLKLNDAFIIRQLRADLHMGIRELTEAATKAVAGLQKLYSEYEARRDDVERNLVQLDSKRRARVRLELEYDFVRRLFGEALPQFEEQYGREIESNQTQERVKEAFIADSVAALAARVLFLRLVEDLNLTTHRRLSNGGPQNWAAFVEFLTGDASALVRVAAEDVRRIYKEPFERTVFDWIQHANGDLDKPLQRFILRLNAYDFSGLSEEILGDIYQQFLPRAKRKRLGEYYTPSSIVDWILDETVRGHGLGSLLDPACGSGSFLVRYAHWRLEDARRRNLERAGVRREIQEEIWGLDLNPFAAFISHFQMIWALLRYLPAAGPPSVHVYNLNSLLRDTDIVPFIGEEHLPPGSKERDSRKWRYVVGNPPYIRAERVKYGGEMRELWKDVWGQNADTGLLFIYRAITEWLEPGGLLGMVVSGGYTSSETAARIWQMLHPERTAAIRKVVWLEFAGKVWEPNVIPMLLVIERTPARDEDEVELSVPSAWPSEEDGVRIRYGDLFDPRVSPRVTNGVASYGDYLLPLLQPEDVPILQRLHPKGNGGDFRELGEVVEWTYGIQRGGVELTESESGTRPIQVVPGRSLAVGWHGESAGWVDLGAVAKRPFGKLSRWSREPYPSGYVAVPSISLAPLAAVIPASAQPVATLNTTIVSIACEVHPSSVAAYLNSSLARYYWAVRLRSAVLAGSSRATFYPRTLQALPWPRALSQGSEADISSGYANLAALAAVAKDNPNEWLLGASERHIEKERVGLSNPILGLRFGEEAEVRADTLRVDGNTIDGPHGIFAEFADPDLAEYVFRIVTLTNDDDALISPADVQRLLAPRDYGSLMQEYRERDRLFRQVERQFMEALAQLDVAVYEAFGVSEAEQSHIEQRLTSFPLDRLRPRYPWQTVAPRPIKAYTEDRFR